MAATTLYRLGRALLSVVTGVVLAMALYGLAAWIGSSIPRNGEREAPEEGVGILVESNGVHTALVLPLVTPEKDWRGDFPVADIAAPGRPYTHVAVSWGEKQVFLETETWGDLSPLTVLRIIGIGGEGLLHVAHYVRPAPEENMRPLLLSREEYLRLVREIERSLPSEPRISHPGYFAQDVFYDAPGNYTASNTCNQWTSDRLADAGVTTGWWTPFAGGVMKWVPGPGRQRE